MRPSKNKIKPKLKEWILLSDSQKKGIMDAIEEIDSGYGRGHADVVNEMRKNYPDAD
jgi:hypothetical protein